MEFLPRIFLRLMAKETMRFGVKITLAYEILAASYTQANIL